jgi:hypothetical protein
MHEQRMAADRPRAGRTDEELDSLVLGVVLDGAPWLWSVDEIGREIDDPAGAQDAVARLGAAGLLHRLGEFVFASRSARRGSELHVGTV